MTRPSSRGGISSWRSEMLMTLQVMAWNPNTAVTAPTTSGLRATANTRWVHDSMTRPSRRTVAGPSQPMIRAATRLAVMPPTASEASSAP